MSGFTCCGIELGVMLARAQSMLDTKSIRRHLRKVRNNLARRFFDTRYGRNLLINSLGPRVQTMTIDCGDHVMSLSPGDYIGKKIFRKGHFEREHVDRLLAILKERRLLRDGTTLLELGGNIGTQTIYFALSGQFARIVSVEPDPRNFDLLRTNVIAERARRLCDPGQLRRGREPRRDRFLSTSEQSWQEQRQPAECIR